MCSTQYHYSILKNTIKRNDFNFPIVRGLLLTRKLLNQGFLVVKLKSTLRKFYCRYHDLPNCYGISVTNDHKKVPFVVTPIQSFPHSWIITGFVTRVTRQVSPVEQELLTLPEHLSSSPVLSAVWVVKSLVFCTTFYRLFVLFLLAIVLSVLSWFMAPDYPFGIFILFLIYCN
jgi:hypothetical protein